ncbi:tRNA (cytidine(34)-2'-O)-methyltransferase [Kiloniella laminariae]|uniref:tRNA (cytidine(34)-2'-O)-methyltransferase n=1 Tax=Kiloniella laminariae TaxID=454162 RepID=A0ABT4LLN4_9PROT|nr:tRNA (cytidine(34)-2'-O)-methyltransferase [Kiloniella laminariae]MCZ4281850.1 tRNA (cytidine(34)-2'-O)-methyltransferase [Kiloniella laminariae]
MRLALYQPDIPQNTGTMLRLAACMKVAVDLIEPCGFVLNDKKLKRSGMDYLEQAELLRHSSWNAFIADRDQRTDKGRLILLSTKAESSYTDFAFLPSDTLMVGRESAGVPEDVHSYADARIIIPMAQGVRSLNVAVSAAMVLGEALRQTAGFPELKAL